jgi:putative lipoprotein
MSRPRNTICFRMLIIVLSILLLSAYVLANQLSGSKVRELSGVVTYRERIALPPDSKVTITLVETNHSSSEALIIAEEIVEPTGQVPIPFVLKYDAGAIRPEEDYGVRAVIEDHQGETLWATTEPYPTSDLDNPEELEILVYQTKSQPETVATEGQVFMADDMQFTAYFEEDMLSLILPDSQMVRLPLVRSASGAKYSDGVTTFWTKGEEAFIELDGNEYHALSIGPSLSPWEKARRQGISFRAVGNEPGWMIEIRDNDVMVFTGDYGEVQITAPVGEAEINPQTGDLIYLAQTEILNLTVTIEETPFTDTMSGEVFPRTVTVNVNGQEYQGGGQELR